MRRRVRWFLGAVAVCLAGSGGFYAGTQYGKVRFLQDHLAAGTAQKVKLLQEFDRKLPNDARLAMAADLPALVASLDEALAKPAVLLVDYNQIKTARDLGLAYLKVYPPTKTAGPSSKELADSLAKRGFYMNLAAEGWSKKEEMAKAEQRVERLLSTFDPVKADPLSRAVYESLTRPASDTEEEEPASPQRLPSVRRPAAKLF